MLRLSVRPSVRPCLVNGGFFFFFFFSSRLFLAADAYLWTIPEHESRAGLRSSNGLRNKTLFPRSEGAKVGEGGVKEKRRRRRSKLDSANFYFFCFWFWSLESFSKILFWEFMTENVLCRVGKLLIEWRNHFLKSSLFSILGFMRATYESLFREYRVKAGSCFKWNGGIAFHPDIFKRWRITKLLK